MDKSHTVILMFSTVPVANNRYSFLNTELNEILGKCYFLRISISSKLNQDIWITGYVCGSSMKASQCKAGARTLGACAHVMTGLAPCFHLSHHVKDPRRGPSDIALTYIPRSFLDIHPSCLSLPVREELINNVYEL